MNSNKSHPTTPVMVIRDEIDTSVAASIWLRSTKAGYFYDVTVSRAYPKSDMEVGYSNTFGGRNLDALCRVLTQSKFWIDEQKQRAVTATVCADVKGDTEPALSQA